MRKETQLKARTIQPDFFSNWPLVEAENKTGLPLMLCLLGLYAMSDREGRFHWDALSIRGKIFANRDNINVYAILAELHKLNLISRYTYKGVNGAFIHYGHVVDWKDLQHINGFEKRSVIPHPESEGCLIVDCSVSFSDALSKTFYVSGNPSRMVISDDNAGSSQLEVTGSGATDADKDTNSSDVRVKRKYTKRNTNQVVDTSQESLNSNHANESFEAEHVHPANSSPVEYDLNLMSPGNLEDDGQHQYTQRDNTNVVDLFGGNTTQTTNTAIQPAVIKFISERGVFYRINLDGSKTLVTDSIDYSEVKNIQFQLTSGEKVSISVNKFKQYTSLYAGVPEEVIEERVKQASQWLTDNQANRKTMSGLPRYLNLWLSNAQNRNQGTRGSSSQKETATQAVSNLVDVMRKKIHTF